MVAVEADRTGKDWRQRYLGCGCSSAIARAVDSAAWESAGKSPGIDLAPNFGILAGEPCPWAGCMGSTQ